MGSSKKLVVVVLGIALLEALVGAAEPLVPCYFLFGDSLVDNGNNNKNVNTTDRANFAPYGVDLPSVPRGRFTNGRTISDIIGEYLGFEDLIPPFLNATGNQILRGVNYASGGAGIRDETGNTEGVISLSRQIKNHRATIRTIATILGPSEANSLLKKCIYAIDMGSNDYLTNYFDPTDYPTSSIYTTEQFAEVLAAQYSEELQTLYMTGARKIAVYGLGKLGCIPFVLNGTSCLAIINDAAALFNTQLLSLVGYLNEKFPDAMFTYINSRSNTSITAIDAISEYGPCCEVATGDELCLGNGTVCANRTDYVFWDMVHPTEAVNLIYASVMYNATSTLDASPYGFYQLAQATELDDPTIMVSRAEIKNEGEMKVAFE